MAQPHNWHILQPTRSSRMPNHQVSSFEQVLVVTGTYQLASKSYQHALADRSSDSISGHSPISLQYALTWLDHVPSVWVVLCLTIHHLIIKKNIPSAKLGWGPSINHLHLTQPLQRPTTHQSDGPKATGHISPLIKTIRSSILYLTIPWTQ